MADQLILPRAVDANDDPVSGALCYVYDAGTSTPKTTYSDTGLSVAHANPVVADGNGDFAAIFLSGTCKVDVQTPGGASLPGYPRDNFPTASTTAGAANLVSYSPTSNNSATTVQGAIDNIDTFVRTSAGVSEYLLDAITITSDTVSVAKEIPSGVVSIRLIWWDFLPSASNSTLLMRLGTGGAGGSFLSTSIYAVQRITASDTSIVGAAATDTEFNLNPPVNTGSGSYRGSGSATFSGFNTAGEYLQGQAEGIGETSGPVFSFRHSGFRTTAVGTYNAVQFLSSTGNIASLQMRIYGVRG